MHGIWEFCELATVLLSLVYVFATFAFPQKFPFEQRCLINFENATVCVADRKLTVYTDDNTIAPTLPSDDCYMEEIRAFLALAFDDTPCEITSPESVSNSISLALCEAESARRGETISL